MTALQVPSPVACWLSSLLVVLVLVGAGPARQDAPVLPETPAEILALSPGLELEREIRGGETASFELNLAANTFLLLEISQRSMGLTTRLRGSAGEEIAAGEGGDERGYQLLAVVAESAGPYRLDVTSRDKPTAVGRYGLKALTLRPSVAGDETRVKAARDLTEGRRLLSQGNPKAIARLEASLASWRAAKEGRGEVEALGDLARFHSDRNEKLEALSIYEQAFQRSREIGFSAGSALALANMALTQIQRGAFTESIDLYKRSLEIWEQAGGAYERAFAHEDLGSAYLYARDPEEALKAFTTALRLAKECGDREREAWITSGLGSAQLGGGQPSEALRTFERALALSQAIGDTEGEESIEHNLSTLYQREGQLQKAVDVILRLIARGRSKGLGTQYLNLGALYLELGDPERAQESYERSREEAQRAKQPAGEVGALIGIASVHQRTGDPQGALAIMEQACRIAPEKSWKILHYLGFAQSEAGRPAQALATLEQALGMARGSHDRLNEASTLLALGSVELQLKKPGIAEERFGQALQLGQAVEAPALVAPALLRRARIRKAQGRLAEALLDAEQGRELVESTRRNIVGQDLKTRFFADRRQIYELSIDLMVQLARHSPGADYAANAFEVSEASRARGLLDLLAEGRIDLRDGLAPELRQREDRLADELSQVQLELRNSDPKPERSRQLQAEIDRLDHERDQLEVEIRGQNRRYADVRYPHPLKLEEIRHSLIDDRTALLEFALGEERSVLFVVTPKGIQTFELPPAAAIDRQVRRLRKSLERQLLLTRRDYLESAFELYRDLLAPAEGALAGIANLLIVPDGSLYYVPFEALLTEPDANRSDKELPYLLRRHSIAYAPSASVLAGLSELRKDTAASGQKQLAAFAPFARPGGEAPTRGTSFEPLPASGREIAGLAGLYPGAALSFLGDDADEDTVKNNAEVAKAHRLHFATHAQIDERYPESSALVFATRGGKHGLLQVHEIFNLKLGADLAVLSACQTALGKEVTGEGLVGLTRAFFYAGVPSLVVSLWNVADSSTPDLMLDFYQDLDRLKDKAGALQSAKLAMIERGTYAHPSYWAPFILIGAPR